MANNGEGMPPRQMPPAFQEVTVRNIFNQRHHIDAEEYQENNLTSGFGDAGGDNVRIAEPVDDVALIVALLPEEIASLEQLIILRRNMNMNFDDDQITFADILNLLAVVPVLIQVEQPDENEVINVMEEIIDRVEEVSLEIGVPDIDANAREMLPDYGHGPENAEVAADLIDIPASGIIRRDHEEHPEILAPVLEEVEGVAPAEQGPSGVTGNFTAAAADDKGYDLGWNMVDSSDGSTDDEDEGGLQMVSLMISNNARIKRRTMLNRVAEAGRNGRGDDMVHHTNNLENIQDILSSVDVTPSQENLPDEVNNETDYKVAPDYIYAAWDTSTDSIEENREAEDDMAAVAGEEDTLECIVPLLSNADSGSESELATYESITDSDTEANNMWLGGIVGLRKITCQRPGENDENVCNEENSGNENGDDGLKQSEVEDDYFAIIENPAGCFPKMSRATRDAFQLYLETSGIKESMDKALIDLYKDHERPIDVLGAFLDKLSFEVPLRWENKVFTEEIEQLQAKIAELTKDSAKLSKEYNKRMAEMMTKRRAALMLSASESSKLESVTDFDAKAGLLRNKDMDSNGS